MFSPLKGQIKTKNPRSILPPKQISGIYTSQFLLHPFIESEKRVRNQSGLSPQQCIDENAKLVEISQSICKSQREFDRGRLETFIALIVLSCVYFFPGLLV